MNGSLSRDRTRSREPTAAAPGRPAGEGAAGTRRPGAPESAVDGTDSRILALLQQNARRSFGDIGREVGLSAPAVKRRIDRLEASGVIRGYTTLVDHARLGQGVEAFAELRFAGSTRVDDIEDIALDVPEVHAIFTVAGDPDALAWIRVRDVQNLKRVIDRLRSSGKVTGTKTLMVLSASLRTPV